MFHFLSEMFVFTDWMAVGKRAGAGEGREKGTTSLQHLQIQTSLKIKICRKYAMTVCDILCSPGEG